MTLNEMQDMLAIRHLVDSFATLSDTKDAKAQGDLFLEDGVLEFQTGFDGEVKAIIGRAALVEAFTATLAPCKVLVHLSGQQTADIHGDTATGTAYCQATLVNTVDGRDMVTVNDVRYTDSYRKVDGKWFIQKRRSTFLLSETHEYKG